MPIHLDFETFSVADIRACGAYRYAQDPSTEVLIMGWAVDDGAVVSEQWVPLLHDRIRTAIDAGEIFMAHNAQFEMAIWKHVLHERYGWPDIPPAQWYCTAAHAASLKLPRSLDKAGAAAQVPIQKDKDGARLIRLFCMPRKPTRKNPSTRIMPGDMPEDFAKFIEYNRIDVESERALEHKLPPMDKREMNVWRYDCKINGRGLPIDTALVKRTIVVVNQLQAQIIQQTRDLTCTADNPEGIAPTQVAKLLEFIQDDGGGVLFTLQRKEIEEKMKLTQFPDRVNEILELRMEGARVSTKKLLSMLKVCGTDSRARGTLLYHGAGPGRWSGRLIQPHNFVRGTYKQRQRDIVVEVLERYSADELQLLFPRPMEAISNVMRAFICAPAGRILYVADYSSIEARILVWLAGQDDMVAMYHKGMDLYIWMASQIYGVTIESIDPETPDGYEKRRTGKHVILGAGYGMGVPKFIITCKEIGGFVVQESIAQLGIDTYRETHHMVKKLWKAMERAAIACVRTGQTQVCGARDRIKFSMWYGTDGFEILFMHLPSGRKISFPFPKLQPGQFGDQLSYMSEDGKTKQWWRETTYGGKLVENAVQGIARDFMLHGMINVEKADYEVVSTVHDEIISERDEGTGSLEEYEKLVCSLPAWGAGCPIAAEGFVAKRWRKN